ncbi:DUF4397 domain-containing protein [Pyxidicoccus sp. 3LG]
MSDGRRSLSILLVSLAIACAAATGCDDDDDSAGLPDGGSFLDAPRSGLFVMRVVHASPDLPSVDVYVNEETTPRFSDVSYGDATDFVPALGREFVLHLRPAGGSVRTQPLFTSRPLVVPSGSSTSLVATGLFEETTHDKTLRVIPLSDSPDPVSPGKVRVRVLHGGVDATRLDVDVDEDGEADVADLDRFEDSGEGGLELPAGMLLRVDVTTGDPAAPLTSFSIAPQPDGSEVLMVISGLLGVPPRLPTGFSLVTANQEGSLGRIRQNAVVYVLNTVADPDGLDVFLDSTEKMDSLEFGGLSERLQVGPEARSVDIFESTPTSNRPGGTALVSLPTSGLTAGEQYLVIIAGPVSPLRGGNPRFRLLPYAEGFEPDEEQLRMRFVHSAPDLSAVDMGPLDAEGGLPSPADADDLPFTQATEPEGLPLPPVEFTLGVRASDDPDAVPTEFFIGPGPLLSAGVFAVLAQAADDVPHLLLVSTARSPWSIQDIPPGRGPRPVPPSDDDSDDDFDGDGGEDDGGDAGEDDGGDAGEDDGGGDEDVGDPVEVPEVPPAPPLPPVIR